MLLTPQEAALFFKLHWALMCFVNQRLQVVSDQPTDPDQFSGLPPETCLQVRNALLERPELLQSFVDANPFQFSGDELDIVRSWRHFIRGKFFILRQLKKYAVFLSATKPAVAYGVVALSQPFEELVGPHLPVFNEAVLLPFKDKIVYDGLLAGYRITFGPGVRRSLNEDFKAAKLRHGVVTSLPMSDEPVPAKTPAPPKAPKATTAPYMQTREQTDEVLHEIMGLTDRFCQEHLDDEYAALCRKLAEKLSRKRPSPLLRGTPNVWASGIVRTIGWANFLHDPSQTPHMALYDIDAGFGVSESSGAAKLAAIRKMLKITPMTHEWCLKRHIDSNPMVWMIQVNGFMMDARQAPRPIQEIAFNKGLIPYIPADHAASERA